MTALPPPAANPRLILASRSPRRSAMLREAGFPFEVATPPFDDPAQPADDVGDIAGLATQLAQHKARSLADHWQRTGQKSDTPRVILAADTLCIDTHGRPVGKPQTREELLAMLQDFVNATHRVTTGVALVPCFQDVSKATTTLTDTALVAWGPLTESQLQTYADSDSWHGKAGGYNLQERVAAGWPITVTGDPGTVTGLPMNRLLPALRRLGIQPTAPNSTAPVTNP